MYSRIFTPFKRSLIQRFLKGEIASSDASMRKLLYRFKTFTELSADVDLYIRLREAISAKLA
ncbi:MAG: hypothetical protein QW328_07225 [Nitrososphaerota archaeon]